MPDESTTRYCSTGGAYATYTEIASAAPIARDAAPLEGVGPQLAWVTPKQTADYERISQRLRGKR